MVENFDVLFLGGLFPKEKEKEIYEDSLGTVQNAANNLQWGLVKGLDKNLQKKPMILNSLYIGSYPKRYKKLIIETYNFSHTTGVTEDLNVGFINISGLKILSRYLSLKPHIKHWANQNNGRKKIVIAYAMTSTFTRLLRDVKNIDSNIVTCLVVPDLPQYMNLTSNKHKIYDILKSIEIKQISKDLNYIDSYVLLTKNMREALNIKVPSVIIEGIATNDFENIVCLPKDKEIKTLLYTGGLSEKYGVLNLVKSFERLTEENYRLIICGSGDAEREVIKASERDKRIIFKGLLRREEILELQKSSNVLINPRPNNENYTKYSFPSKILEYLSSGTPVISYQLDGIPDEYSDYMYIVDHEEDGLYKKLKSVLAKSDKELDDRGRLSKEFVLMEKNSEKQVEKILKMLKSL